MTPTPRALSRRQRWHKQRALAIANGTWGDRYIPAAPAAEHIHKLRAAGMSTRSIAITAGLAQSTIQPLVWPHRNRRPRTHLRPETAAAILAVRATPDQIPPDRYTHAAGTIRRLRGLAVLGYDIAYLADRLNVYPSAVSRLQCARSDRVTGRTARAVADVYRELAVRPGPNPITRTRAHRKGWHGPGVWDDDIDDPIAEPLGARRRTA